jgi:plastocyanin
MKRLLLLALPLTLLALAGCGSSSKSSSTPPATSTPASSTPASSTSPGSGGAVTVAMKNLAFVPTSVTAKVGQTVDFVNSDTPPHNVTYKSGPKFTSSSTISPGGKFSIKLTQAGTIHYVCTIHPFMKATIVVTK